MQRQSVSSLRAATMLTFSDSQDCFMTGRLVKHAYIVVIITGLIMADVSADE